MGRRGLLSRQDVEDYTLGRAGQHFPDIAGAFTFDVTPRLRKLLETRVELINVATGVAGGYGWESISCRQMYQEGRLMNHASKTGYEFSNQCRVPHALTWAILDAIGYRIPKANTYEDIQIVFNRYVRGHHCPMHRDYKGLGNIVYIIFGPVGGLFSFHNPEPPHGVVSSANLRNKILFLRGDAREIYLHGVSGIGDDTGSVPGAARYCMRIATVLCSADDVQHRKRLGPALDANAPSAASSTTLPAYVHPARIPADVAKLRSSVVALEAQAMRRGDFVRGGYLTIFLELLDVVEGARQRARDRKKDPAPLLRVQGDYSVDRVVVAAEREEDTDALRTMCLEIAMAVLSAEPSVYTPEMNAVAEAKKEELFSQSEATLGARRAQVQAQEIQAREAGADKAPQRRPVTKLVYSGQGGKRVRSDALRKGGWKGQRA